MTADYRLAKEETGASKVNPPTSEEWEAMDQLRDDEGNPFSHSRMQDAFAADDLFRAAVRLALRIGETKGEEQEECDRPLAREGAVLSPLEVWNEYLADDLFRSAVRLVLENRKPSVSLIQRRLRAGFARAGRLVDMMQEAGLVGPFRGGEPREIIVDPDHYLRLLDAYEKKGEIERKSE